MQKRSGRFRFGVRPLHDMLVGPADIASMSSCGVGGTGREFQYPVDRDVLCMCMG